MAVGILMTILCCSIFALSGGSTLRESNDAKLRLYRDFVKTLYNEAAATQVNNIYNMLHLYSHSTIEQTQQVVEYIEVHANLSKAESIALRLASNTSIETSDCVLRNELALLQSYRNTGYNLHNCIRSAQLGYEKSYSDLNAKLDILKTKAIRASMHYNATLDNCADNDCVMRTLVQAVVRYEEMKEELDTEVVAGNNLNSRYIVTSIALGCVSSALNQIHGNYNVGKNLMAGCFHSSKTNETGK